VASTLDMIDAIKARLTQQLPGLAVEYFPDKPAEYRLNHPRGAVLVSYLGSSFEKTVSTAVIAQPRTLRFGLTLMMRQLNQRQGAVALLDAVRCAMIGFVLPGGKKSWVLSERYLGESGGIWQYALDIANETLELEDTEPDNGALSTRITFFGEVGNDPKVQVPRTA
jgi:hypothetical protein